MTQKTALIVDDSATARLMLSRVLESMDIVSKQAKSGEDALRVLTLDQPDVIFLDHLMPGMDGFQTLKQLKQNPSTTHIPVFMYTSQSAMKYQEEAKALGAEGVITKQIKREKLYLLVEKATAKRDLQYGYTSVANGTSIPEITSEPLVSSPNVVPIGKKSKKKDLLEQEVTDLENQVAELKATIASKEEESSKSKIRPLQVVAFFLAAVAMVLFLKLQSQQDQIRDLKTALDQSTSALSELIFILEKEDE